jgi:hypothetical protein
MRMSALMARLAALGLFLLWNFHAGLHLWHAHGHEEDVECGPVLVAEHDQECGACHLGVAPGLTGVESRVGHCLVQTGLAALTPFELPVRRFCIADVRGPPAVFA